MKKHKKMLAVLVALSCVTTAFPQFAAPAYAEEVVYDSFELNYDGWHGTDKNGKSWSLFPSHLRCSELCRLSNMR